jgi:septum formation protein
MDRERPFLILASRSPRRRELLAEAGYRFEVWPPSDSAEETTCPGRSPAEVVAELAYRKAADVASRVGSGVVIGCDTVAECDGEILGKPDDETHARQMLKTLRGRPHRVHSGLCVWPIDGSPRVEVETTHLRMDPLGNDEIEAYLASGAWRGKAGAFGYQDRLGWVKVVAGSESNVVGLPMELLERMLRDLERA